MFLDKRYFERKEMKSKEVEDVLGGSESWKNVDKTEGVSLQSFFGRTRLGTVLIHVCSQLCKRQM